MDMQTRKNLLIDFIRNLTDQVKLMRFEQLMHEKFEANGDWWDELSPEVQKDIEAGWRDYKEGRTLSHEEVQAKIKAKYNLK